MPDPASLDGVNVFGIKRVVANLDDDPEDELALLINYSTGMCTFCSDQVLFGILDKQKEGTKIAWQSDGFRRESYISFLKLFKKDKFLEIAVTLGTRPLGTGSSAKQTSILRWTGKAFVEIWSYTLSSYDQGNRGGIPHGFTAKLDFRDDKTGVKRIRVIGKYSSPHYAEEQTQYALYEEFSWNEQAQKYLSVKQIKVADIVELLEVLNAPRNLIESTKKTEESSLERIIGY